MMKTLWGEQRGLTGPTPGVGARGPDNIIRERSRTDGQNGGCRQVGKKGIVS